MSESLVPETRVLAVASHVRIPGRYMYTVNSNVLVGGVWVRDRLDSSTSVGLELTAHQPCGKYHGHVGHAVDGL